MEQTTTKARREEGIQRVALQLVAMPGVLLVVHNFSEKAKAEIRAKQQKTPKQAKEKRDPEAECEVAKYLDGAGRESVPITAVKKAMISACTAMDNLTKVAIRQALFVWPTSAPGSMFVPIESSNGGGVLTGVMREDAVTIGINTRGLAYRPEYQDWKLRVTVEYNPRLVSRAQVMALATQAGWGVGICEGRPEKSSALGWGRFRVEVEDAA